MEWLAESCWTLSNASKGAAVTERDGVGSVAVVASSYSHSQQANRASTNSTNRRDPTTKTSHSSAYSSSSGAKQHSSGSFQPLFRTTKPCNFSCQLRWVQVDCNMFRVQVKFKSVSPFLWNRLCTALESDIFFPVPGAKVRTTSRATTSSFSIYYFHVRRYYCRWQQLKHRIVLFVIGIINPKRFVILL